MPTTSHVKFFVAFANIRSNHSSTNYQVLKIPPIIGHPSQNPLQKLVRSSLTPMKPTKDRQTKQAPANQSFTKEEQRKQRDMSMLAYDNKEGGWLIQDAKQEQNWPESVGAAGVEVNVKHTKGSELSHQRFVWDYSHLVPTS